MAADLLSQAEHGTDSQVVLVAINLTDKQLDVIQVHEAVLILGKRRAVQGVSEWHSSLTEIITDHRHRNLIS